MSQHFGHHAKVLSLLGIRDSFHNAPLLGSLNRRIEIAVVNKIGNDFNRVIIRRPREPFLLVNNEIKVFSYFDHEEYFASNVTNAKRDFRNVVLDRQHENICEFPNQPQILNIQVPGSRVSQRIPRRNVLPHNLSSRRRPPGSQLFIPRQPLKQLTHQSLPKKHEGTYHSRIVFQIQTMIPHHLTNNRGKNIP